MKKLLEKIEKWAVETALPWLKKAWLQIINVFIIFLAYAKFDDLANGEKIDAPLLAGILGLWGFVLLAYWLFWKFFGMDKMFKSKNTEKKKK